MLDFESVVLFGDADRLRHTTGKWSHARLQFIAGYICSSSTCIAFVSFPLRVSLSLSRWLSVVMLFQALLATALNCQGNKLSVETQHTGGGFGGKLTRNAPIACAVAYAAKKMNKPVRCQNTRRKDIDMWAKRHPFQCDYKVGFMNDGTIEALHLQLYIAGGYTYDTVYGIMQMAINWSDVRPIPFHPTYCTRFRLTRCSSPAHVL